MQSRLILWGAEPPPPRSMCINVAVKALSDLVVMEGFLVGSRGGAFYMLDREQVSEDEPVWQALPSRLPSQVSLSLQDAPRQSKSSVVAEIRSQLASRKQDPHAALPPAAIFSEPEGLENKRHALCVSLNEDGGRTGSASGHRNIQSLVSFGDASSTLIHVAKMAGSTLKGLLRFARRKERVGGSPSSVLYRLRSSGDMAGSDPSPSPRNADTGRTWA